MALRANSLTWLTATIVAVVSGVLSASTTPCAATFPVLLTSIVYVTVSPTRTVARSAVFVTCRSATGSGSGFGGGIGVGGSGGSGPG